MRKNSQNHCAQGQLPFSSDKPVLDILRPVKIEIWHEEGLFKRSGYGTDRKIRFIIAVRSSAFDYASPEMCEAKGQSTVSRVEIIADKMQRARRVFDAVEDERMRDIMREMILRVDLVSARYTAKICGYAWPQFTNDFNKGLDQAIAARDARRLK